MTAIISPYSDCRDSICDPPTFTGEHAPRQANLKDFVSIHRYMNKYIPKEKNGLHFFRAGEGLKRKIPHVFH